MSGLIWKREKLVSIGSEVSMIMTADVTAEHAIFNRRCIAVMEEVREAIRGK